MKTFSFGKKLFASMIISCGLPFLVLADSPKISSFKLNGVSGPVTFNASTGTLAPLSIELNTEKPTKFTVVAICKNSETDCNTTHSIRYFSPGSKGYITTLSLSWDGKSKSDGPVAEDGIYKIRASMYGEGDAESTSEDLSATVTVDSNYQTQTGTTTSSGNGSSGDSSVATQGGGSAHYSQSQITSKLPIKVNAGRNRLASVKTPINFTVEKEQVDDEVDSYAWSFGDGAVAYGESVKHAYQFSGTYNVVLNASRKSGKELVSRTKVVVTDSNLEISEVNTRSGYIKIKNNGESEENLNGWLLQNLSGGNFIFPKDTIIDARAELKIPISLIGQKFIDQEIVFLKYVNGDLATSSLSFMARENNRKNIVPKDRSSSTEREEDISRVSFRENTSDDFVAIKKELPRMVTSTKTDKVIVLTKEEGTVAKFYHWLKDLVRS